MGIVGLGRTFTGTNSRSAKERGISGLQIYEVKEGGKKTPSSWKKVERVPLELSPASWTASTGHV